MTEHRVLACQCQRCGKALSGKLTIDVAAAPASYGKRIAGFVLYFSAHHFAPTEAGIKVAIGTASVVGSDETFVREGGRRINIWV